MAINLTTEPYRLISAPTIYSRYNYAFNPYTWAFTFSGIPAGATSLKVDVELLGKAGTLISTHAAYAFNSVAYLDVSKFVNALFTDQSAYAADALLNDPSLYAKFYVKFRESYYNSSGTLVTGNWTTSSLHTAVRGVAQVGGNKNLYEATHNHLLFHTGSLYSTTGEFLTTFTDRVIPVWDGYDRDISLALADWSESLSLHRLYSGVETNTQITQDGTYPGYVARMRISTNVGNTHPWTSIYVRNIADTQFCSRVYTLDNMTVGSNPFYVRWLNQLGGWDHWLFEKRQVITNATSDTKSVRRDIASSFDTARSTHKVYSRRGSLAYRVGATNLSQVRFDALSAIIDSPRIEWYDGTNWLEVIPEDGAQELTTDKPAGEVEFTFFLPERQMMY